MLLFYLYNKILPSAITIENTFVVIIYRERKILKHNILSQVLRCGDRSIFINLKSYKGFITLIKGTFKKKSAIES